MVVPVLGVRFLDTKFQLPGFRVGPYLIMQNFIAISLTVAELWWFTDFQNGSSPPSWIYHAHALCNPCFRALYKIWLESAMYLWKYARVSMLWNFGLRMPIHAIFGEFWEIKMGKRKLFAALSFCERNNQGLTSIKSTSVKIGSAVGLGRSAEVVSQKNW